MNGSIARRAALALSAFAFVVSVISMPSNAAAAPANDGQPPAKTTPSPLILYPPDLQVTSLGTVHHAATPDGYLFEVENIGQGPANKVDLYKQTKIYKRVGNLFIKTDTFKYTHQTPLNPGQSFKVEVSCNARGPEYCDFGSLGVVVVNPVVQDSDVSNNYAIDNDDILGKPQL
jgi:hypothetical protein